MAQGGDGRTSGKYTDKQRRKAGHIAESYEARGVPEKEAEARAWATVNKADGGGRKPGGSRRGKSADRPAGRGAAERSASAKSAAATRRANPAAEG